jgi:integrase
MTLGTTDVLGLADARERARDLLIEASGGADPATTKKAARVAETVEDLAEAYIERHAKVRKRSWKDDDAMLRHKVLPVWRHRAIEDITRRDVRELVEQVGATAPIAANRLASLLSKLFAFALDRDLVQASPAVRIPRPGQEKTRDRVLTEDEIRAFWTASEGLDPARRAFYRLRLLLAQRGGEVAGMQWQDLDLTGGWWTIPATGSKDRLQHRVPLGASALAILKALTPKPAKQRKVRKTADAVKAVSPKPDYVLAGARGKRQQAEAARVFDTIPDFRGHDLRRTAATMMARGGVARLTIAKLLNHVEQGVTAVYDRASYDAEKQAAITWWDAHLKGILVEPVKDRRGTVRAFKGRAR